MTPSELAQHAPHLAEIREMLIAEINGIFAPDNLRLGFDQCDIDATGFLLLGMCHRAERLRREKQASSNAVTTWRFAMPAVVNGTRVLVFKSNSGALAKIPADFVRAVLRGQTLYADMSDSVLDSDAYTLSRSGRFEAHVPTTLLDYLLDLRAKGETAGLLAAAGGVTAEAGAKGEALPRPTKHATERPASPPAEDESEPGDTEP